MFSHENSVGFDRLIGSEIAIPDGIEKTWTKMFGRESKRLLRFGRLEPAKIACQDQDHDKSGLKSALAVDRIPLHVRLFSTEHRGACRLYSR